MEIKKIILLLGSVFLLNGCLQSTAMVGPAMTLASTGSIYQAGFTYSANKAVEKETGMSAHEYLSKVMNNNEVKNQKDKDSELDEDLLIMVRSNFEKTRKIIIDQSNNTNN